MDVVVTFVGFERLEFFDVLHMSYTYNVPELVLTIITDSVHQFDMRDVVGVEVYEK